MQAVQRHAADGRPRARHLQRVPDPLRGAPAARRAAAERGPDVRLEARGRRGRADRHRVHLGLRRRRRDSGCPVAHGDGRFVAADDTLRMLEAEGRVVLRYVASSRTSAASAQSRTARRTTSPGICNAAGTVVGIMPHPERVADPLLGVPDGLGFFTSLLAWRPQRLHAQGAQPMTTDKPSRNEDEYFVKQEAEPPPEPASPGRGGRARGRAQDPFMKCPKDGYDLTSSDYHGVQIETCPHCGGMWLDAGELDAVVPRGPARPVHPRALAMRSAARGRTGRTSS